MSLEKENIIQLFQPKFLWNRKTSNCNMVNEATEKVRNNLAKHRI